MFVDLFFLILKLFGVLLVILIARAVQMHFKVQGDISRLKKQGIFSYPGNDAFLVGPIPHLEEERKKRM